MPMLKNIITPESLRNLEFTLAKRQDSIQSSISRKQGKKAVVKGKK